jgi:hypothetical protein
LSFESFNAVEAEALQTAAGNMCGTVAPPDNAAFCQVRDEGNITRYPSQPLNGSYGKLAIVASAFGIRRHPRRRYEQRN